MTIVASLGGVWIALIQSR